MSDEKKSILIVDDTPDNILLIIDLLGNTYHVTVATSVENALNSLSNIPVPDLILLDVMMPMMSGFELCEQLKINPLTKRIPVVFISGHTEQILYEKGLSLGAAGFLSKPIVSETLHATIGNAILPSGSLEEIKLQQPILI